MDMEGIIWVGNIYQKFEALCLEVEEIMYEDTVKYVENQVQTVGATVKKFYSDVMQDLVPPCSEDFAKEAVTDFPVELHSDVDMKKKLGMKEKHVKVDYIKWFSEDSKLIGDNNLDCQRTLHELFHVDHLFPPSQGGCLGGDSTIRNKESLTEKSNPGVTKISKKKNLSLDGADLTRTSSACEITSLDEDLIRAFSVCKSWNESFESYSNPKANITTSASAENINETENVSEQLPYILTNKPSSNMVDSGRSNRTDIVDSSTIRLIAESNAAYAPMNNDVVSPVESSANDNLQSCLFSDDQDFASNSGRSDESNTDVTGDDNCIEQDMEIIQHVEQIKLHETCIVVNRDEFHLDPFMDGKSRPYKKKIQDAFSSRKKSARKREYEQLAALYRCDTKFDQEESMKSSTPTVSGTRRSPTGDFCESEWELL